MAGFQVLRVFNPAAEVEIVTPESDDLLQLYRLGQTYPFYCFVHDIGGGGGGLNTVLPPVNHDFSVEVNNRYHVDTTSSAVTALMPDAPSAGDIVAFVDSTGGFGTHSLTIDWNGRAYMGSMSDAVLSIAYSGLQAQFNGTQWVPIP